MQNPILFFPSQTGGLVPGDMPVADRSGGPAFGLILNGREPVMAGLPEVTLADADPSRSSVAPPQGAASPLLFTAPLVTWRAVVTVPAEGETASVSSADSAAAEIVRVDLDAAEFDTIAAPPEPPIAPLIEQAGALSDDDPAQSFVPPGEPREKTAQPTDRHEWPRIPDSGEAAIAHRDIVSAQVFGQFKSDQMRPIEAASLNAATASQTGLGVRQEPELPAPGLLADEAVSGAETKHRGAGEQVPPAPRAGAHPPDRQPNAAAVMSGPGQRPDMAQTHARPATPEPSFPSATFDGEQAASTAHPNRASGPVFFDPMFVPKRQDLQPPHGSAVEIPAPDLVDRTSLPTTPPQDRPAVMPRPQTGPGFRPDMPPLPDPEGPEGPPADQNRQANSETRQPSLQPVRETSPAPRDTTLSGVTVPPPATDRLTRIQGDTPQISLSPGAEPTVPVPETPIRNVAPASGRAADAFVPFTPVQTLREQPVAETSPLQMFSSEAPLAEIQAADRPVTVSSPALPRHLAMQLVEIARVMPDRPVQLTLSPEELGRVRLSLHAEGSSMAVTVMVERPETYDLMRRHIEILAQEMRGLGYRDVSFSFSQSWQGQGSGAAFQDDGSAASGTRTPDIPADGNTGQPPLLRLNLDPANGIDMRL